MTTIEATLDARMRLGDPNYAWRFVVVNDEHVHEGHLFRLWRGEPAPSALCGSPCVTLWITIPESYRWCGACVDAWAVDERIGCG